MEKKQIEISEMWEDEILRPIKEIEIETFEFNSNGTLEEKLLFSAVTGVMNGELMDPDEAKKYLFDRYNSHVVEHNTVIEKRRNDLKS